MATKAMHLKRCPRCTLDKPTELFGMARQRKDGRRVYCRACESELKKAKLLRDPEAARAPSRRWAAANRERVCERSRGWYEKNKVRRLETAKRWQEANPEKVRQAQTLRRATPECRIKRTISNRIRCFVSGKAGRKTIDLIGYTAEELKAHLERQFLPGMTWANYGDWHIDHIIPVAAFRFASIDDPEIRRAWSLPNLRPLWAKANLQKRDKVLHLI